MMCKTVVKLCLYLNIFLLNVVYSQIGLPPNPCPQYFEYIDNGHELEGQIKLKFKISESVVNLVFEASIPTRLTSVSE